MIWEVEESHEAELAEKLVEELKEELAGMGVEPERVAFRPMVLPIFKVLPKFITDFVEQVKKLGKIPEDAREKLLN
jgi:coenzyme F420-reducing hydrogenase delta subunit